MVAPAGPANLHRADTLPGQDTRHPWELEARPSPCLRVKRGPGRGLGIRGGGPEREQGFTLQGSPGNSFCAPQGKGSRDKGAIFEGDV